MRLPLALRPFALFAAAALLAPSSGAQGPGKPTPEACIAAYRQAQELRLARKLVRSLEKLQQCARPGCHADLQKDCVQWTQEVKTSLPTVVIAARDRQGRQVTAVRVAVDGEPLTTQLDGSALAVDPGNHRFRYEVAGEAPIEEDLLLQEGEKLRQIAVSFGAAAAPPASSLAPPPVSAPPTSAPPPAASAAARGGSLTRRSAGYVVGGAGLLALGVGGFFGLRALSRARDSDRVCPSEICNDESALQANREAKTSALLADIGVGVGLLALGASAFLVLTSANEPPTAGKGAAARVGARATAVRVGASAGVRQGFFWLGAGW